MKLNNKTYYLIALSVGVYTLLTLFFFNPMFLLDSSINMVDGLTVLLIASGVSFALIKVSKKTNNNLFTQIVFILNFLLAMFVSASVLWLIRGSGKSLFTLYISSFVIASLLPMMLTIIWLVFESAKSKIKFAGHDDKDQPFRPKFTLLNSKSRVVLEVEYEKIICFEANDNYVLTHYLKENGDRKKSLDRLSLKQVENILKENSIDFFRVHKSFIVNPAFIESIGGKSQAYKLTLKLFDSEVPVSRSFDISSLPQ